MLLEPSLESELKSLVAGAENGYWTDLGGFDSGLQVTVEKAERPGKGMDRDDGKETVALLASLHHGVLAMSPDVAGLVQTSTNLATVSTKGDVVEIVTSQRSAIESSMLAAAPMVATVCGLAEFEVEHGGKYPGWKPEPNSDIVRKLQEVHKNLFGEPTRLIARRLGVRRHRREVSGHADGVLRADDRRSAQPERARADFVCGEFLDYLKPVLENL